jgi:hypothetical protein
VFANNEKINYIYTSKNNLQTILLLANASLQAYQAFDKSDPERCQESNIDVKQLPGFEFVECWQAHNSINRNYNKIEIFGVIFRTKLAPYTYLFAFRGTSSTANIISDIRTRKVPFTAFNKRIHIGRNVLVHNGMFKTYSQSSNKHNTNSMRDKLFSLIDKYQKSTKPINKLLITGHSLGAALSTLFTLDIALARAEIPTLNINFASPKVGNSSFVKFYQQQTPQKNLATRTLRVVNSFDIVPCTPKIAYSHTPHAYLLSFYQYQFRSRSRRKKKGVHSLLNYIGVLRCANQSNNGICDKTIKVQDQQKTIRIRSKKGDLNVFCKKS